MVRRAFTILLALALLTGACADSGDDSTTPEFERDAPQGSVLPPASQGGPGEAGTEPDEPEENPDDGRLVVQSTEKQLSTMLPDGSEVAELTEPGTINTQASWAPDGSRIAWVAVDESTGTTAVATDRFDRSDFRSVEVETAPFYLYWDPSAARIAHLSPNPAGIDLGVAEPLAEDGPTNRRIDRGEPYFLAWGPDGDELLVHASGLRLDRIDLGSATVIVDEFPALFGAPAWLTDDSLVFADIEEDAQFLVTSGSAGEGRRPLVTYQGSLRFAVSNLGNRIVMQAAPIGPDEDSIVTASAETAAAGQVSLASQPAPSPTSEFDDSLDAIDEIEAGIPYAIGTFGGEPFALSDRPALALYPSPDGQAIAWAEATPGIAGAITWRVDSGTAVYSTPPFIPSAETLDNYLPFFDQYNLSHDVWSPSSNLFVFAGRPLATAEPDGIWIMDRTSGEIGRISDGVVASFTRTPTAAGATSAL